MFLLEIYFTLTLIVFIITIPFYISRVREYRSVKSQYSILIQESDRICYPAHGSSENRWQNDYINMYYEKKEKFGKN